MIYYRLFRKDLGYSSERKEYHQLRLNTKHRGMEMFNIFLYKCGDPKKEGYRRAKDKNGIYYYKYL